MEKGFEKVRLQVGSSLDKIGLINRAAFAYFAAKILSSSNLNMPLPLDVINTRSYMASFVAGTAAGFVTGRSLEGECSAAEAGKLRNRARAGMAAAGLAVGALVNAYAAKKIGVNIGDSSAGLADLGYGMAGATTGALMNNTVEIVPDADEAPDEIPIF